MSTITISDVSNAKFVFKNILDGMQNSIDVLSSPLNTASPQARLFLNKTQISSIDQSFLKRKNKVKQLASDLYSVLSTANDPLQFQNFLTKYQIFRDQYFATEKVHDFYTDMINTRALAVDIGPMLIGCDNLATQSLKPLLSLNHKIPPVLCYADFGQGASIIRSHLILWDGDINPVAVIKVVYSAISSLKLLSICHEAGHAAGAITGWNDELSKLIYDIVLQESRDKNLAEQWSAWHTEIQADMWANALCNYGSLMSLFDTLASNPSQVFFIPAVHPMSFLRIHLNATFCRIAFGKGPWDEIVQMWNMMYDQRSAVEESRTIIEKSIPIMPKLCKTMMYGKMKSFGNKSLNEITPFDKSSPSAVKKILKKDLSDFSSYWSSQTDPILSLLALRVIQMHGKRDQSWIQEQIKRILVGAPPRK